MSEKPKEAVFDAEIRPHLDRVMDLCQKHDLPFACVVQLDGEAPRFQDVGEGARDSRLARRPGDEGRISRIDSNELAGESDGVASGYVHRSTPAMSIVNDNSSPSGATASRTCSTRSLRAISSTHPPPDAPNALAPAAPACVPRASQIALTASLIGGGG